MYTLEISDQSYRVIKKLEKRNQRRLRIINKKVASFKEFLDYTGKDHLHHRLAALGFSKWQTVNIIYLLMAIMGFSAIILKNGSTFEAILGLFQMSLMLITIMILMRKGGDLLQKKL